MASTTAGGRRTLRFEMPFALTDPVLVNPGLGIARVRRRGGRNNALLEQTLLDTPDHRLLRAGIVLSHRVVDGLGEWYLDAPTWGPWLPTNRTEELMAAGDLPEEFASLVRPFRRRSALGPVAALVTDRAGWQLLDADGQEVATLRDERTAVRQGGVTTARFRELTVVGGKNFNRAQRDFVTEVLTQAGGSSVAAFPTMAERIGAPATGLSDFRGTLSRDQDPTLEAFVSWLFSRRLQGVMEADLGLRSGQRGDMDDLRKPLVELRRELRSLAFALEPEWRAALEADIDVVLRTLPDRTVHQLGDEYFGVLDALVLAVRAPKLGDASQQQAAEVLRRQTLAGATILLDRARSLTLTSTDERWAATLASAQQMVTMAHTDRLVFGKQAKRMEQMLDELLVMLRQAQQPDVGEPLVDLEWDPVTAFQEGRRHERRRQECLRAREAFLDAWPDVEVRLAKLRKKGVR